MVESVYSDKRRTHFYWICCYLYCLVFIFYLMCCWIFVVLFGFTHSLQQLLIGSSLSPSSSSLVVIAAIRFIALIHGHLKEIETEKNKNNFYVSFYGRQFQYICALMRVNMLFWNTHSRELNIKKSEKILKIIVMKCHIKTKQKNQK